MKKTPLYALAAFSLLLSSTSCKKWHDHEHPNAPGDICRLTQLHITDIDGNPATYNVNYNGKGDPTDILGPNPPASNMPMDQHFRYDSKGRVTDYIINIPGNIGAMTWNKYVYNKPNFVTDTLIAYIGIIDEAPPIAKDAPSYYIHGYTLDTQGRIVKKWDISKDDPNAAPVLTETITYDANGNAQPSGAALVYDDKVNVYRTNKAWQFVYKDYSRNNRIFKDSVRTRTYNTAGLPTTIDNLYPLQYIFALPNYAPEISYSYACKLPNGPVKY